MELSERQVTVLRALVAAYVGDASPVGSTTLARTLPVRLSSASIRNTMAELTELGLLEQPHTSSGRVPTEQGLRLFVDQLLAPMEPGAWERRLIAGELDEAQAGASIQVASQLLSERTRQLGFVVRPRLDRVVLRHVSLVRLSSERILVVLVSQSGVTYQRVVDDEGGTSQRSLERISTALNQRVSGHTLSELRGILTGEARALRTRASALLQRALEVAVRVLADEASREGDVVIATRLALLDHPEFRDPERLRELLEAIETREILVSLLDQMLDRRGVAVSFGGELAEPALRHCAVVTAPYGPGGVPVGAVGVLGPSRMDFSRVIPLVDYVSRVVTEKICA